MKTIRYGGSVRTRTVPRGNPIGYPSSGGPPLPPADRFLFNGVNQWLSIPGWTPTSKAYTLSCYMLWQANATGGGSLSVNSIMGKLDSTKNIYVAVSTGAITVRSTLAAGGNSFLTSGAFAQSDDVVFIESVTGDPLGVDLTVTPGAGDSNPGQDLAISVPTIEGIAGLSTNSFLNAYVAEVRLLDHADPSNSRWYPMDEKGEFCLARDPATGDILGGLQGQIQNYTDNWGPIGEAAAQDPINGEFAGDPLEWIPDP